MPAESSPGATQLVDWGLAHRIACAGLAEGPSRMPGQVDLGAAATRSEAAVIDYTELSVGEPLPIAEWVSRREWAAINLTAMGELLEPLDARLQASAGLGNGRVAAAAGRVLAVEIGALVGFASRHVLAQYEFPLLGGERRPRLIFVGENLGNAAGRLGARPDQLLEWVALHEVTHAVHLSSAPWLRTHIGDLARRLISDSPARIPVGEILSRARALTSTDPRQTLARLRESDPASLLAPAKSVELINSVQAAMASIEGFAEHVMDAAAGELGSTVERLRAGVDDRRANRSPIVRLLSWTFGIELKLRQYKDGKRFCDEVVAATGINGLNRAWDGPSALPDLTELARPSAWIERVALAPTPA